MTTAACMTLALTLARAARAAGEPWPHSLLPMPGEEEAREALRDAIDGHICQPAPCDHFDALDRLRMATDALTIGMHQIGAVRDLLGE